MEIQIDFSDDTISTGEDHIILNVAPFITIAGKAIKTKAWILKSIEKSDVWKVAEMYNNDR